MCEHCIFHDTCIYIYIFTISCNVLSSVAILCLSKNGDSGYITDITMLNYQNVNRIYLQWGMHQMRCPTFCGKFEGLWGGYDWVYSNCVTNQKSKLGSSKG